MQTNFEDRFKVMERFWGGLDTLARAGYTDLVRVLRQEGPGVVGVVDQLTADLSDGQAAMFEKMIDDGAESMGYWAGSLTDALGIEEAAFAAAGFLAGEAMAGGLEAALTGGDRLQFWIEQGYTIKEAIKFGVISNPWEDLGYMDNPYTSQIDWSRWIIPRDTGGTYQPPAPAPVTPSGDVTVQLINPSTQDLPTDLVVAAQIASAITGMVYA